jgi:hypothetical protein
VRRDRVRACSFAQLTIRSSSVLPFLPVRPFIHTDSLHSQIWFAHKRVCGGKSNALPFPPLSYEEAEQARKLAFAQKVAKSGEVVVLAALVCVIAERPLIEWQVRLLSLPSPFLFAMGGAAVTDASYPLNTPAGTKATRADHLARCLQSVLTGLRAGNDSPFDPQKKLHLLCVVRDYLRIHLQNTQLAAFGKGSDEECAVPLTSETLAASDPHWIVASVANVFAQDVGAGDYNRRYPLQQSWYREFLDVALMFSTLHYLRKAEELKQLSLLKFQQNLDHLRALVGYMTVSLRRLLNIINSPPPGLDEITRNALVEATRVLTFKSGVRIE